jgi:hypothetical protein
MDPNAIRTAFRQHAQIIEDLWVEADCYKTLILHYGLLTAEQLEETLEEAKRDPIVKKRLDDKFGALRQTLDKLGFQAFLEAQSSKPPDSSKEN